MDSPDLNLNPEDEVEKPSVGKWLWSEFKFFSKLFVFILAFTTIVWGHYKIPSESMQPTLEVGDHLYVSKYAYGISKHSLPYYLHNLPIPEGRLFSRVPKRGDVVVFRNAKSVPSKVMIKRVVGLPGDRIQVRQGQLYINGKLVARSKVEKRHYRDFSNNRIREVDVYQQTLAGMDRDFTIYELSDKERNDDTPVFVVPESQLFFMGDSRDNSVDSRVLPSKSPARDLRNEPPGMVHMNYVIGRAERMMFSFNRCNRDEHLHCPPKGRVMEKL